MSTDAGMAAFETASLSRLKQLSEGDTVAVRYNSVYSDDRQTLTGTVSDTEFESPTGCEHTWATVYVDPESQDERRDCYSEHENRPPRRIDGVGFDDSSPEAFTLETRNGARWNQLSTRGDPEIKVVDSDE